MSECVSDLVCVLVSELVSEQIRVCMKERMHQ